MNDKLFILKTNTEHGLTDSRIIRCVSQALNVASDDSRLVVHRTANGKPVLPYVNIHVSVSHSGGIWACVVSDSCVGLDIQKVQKCSNEKITNRYFHPSEKEWLKHNPEDFFRIWSIKESYVKFCGDGLMMGLDSFSAISDDSIAASINGAGIKSFVLENDLFTAICGGTEEFEIIEFFE